MHTAVHVTLPGHQVAQAPIRARETVSGFLRRTGWSTDALPTICVLNGKPLMRADWGRRRLRKKDRLAFVSKPLGGGSAQGKQIAGLVAMIALVALAPYVAGPAAAAFFGGSAIAQSVIGAAFVAGGAFAINTLIAPKAGGQDDDPGQIYSFGTQSNSARVLQTIPVSYGRVKRAPDYAAVPWSEFIGNEQFLHMVLVDGLGKYDRHQILVDDTVLWDSGTGINSEFSGVSIDFYDPGEEITSFPLNVATAAEVSGQELPDDLEWVGGFIANAAGTTATHIAIDIVFPGGLYQVDGNGNLSPVFVPVTAQYRPVDDLGAPTGSWTTLFTQAYGGQTKKPKRFSRKVAVSAGRYEVRLRRNNDASTDSNIVDGVAWAGLRAYLTGPQSFPGVSVTAITMRATQQLTSAAAQRMSVISTRILPVWNGSAWVEQATRSPAWAMWDIATNEDYGARRALSKVDLQAVLALDAGATTRGDCFDFTFSSAMGVPEALDTALRVTRAKHRWAGDVLTLVRDEWRDVPSMMLTDHEIVRGSLSVEYLMQPEDSADAVIVEYIDETVWQPAEVQVPTDYAAQHPVRIQLPGIVQRAQAWREGQFLYRQSQYRRVRPTLETEHDGRLVSMGDHLLIQSDIPGAWGAAGKVVGEDEGTLTLEPPPVWAESGQHYISLRNRIGGAFGPVKCAKGDTTADCILDPTDLALVEAQQETTLAEVLARSPGAEHPSYAHGLGTAWQRRCIAMTGAPSGDRVQLVLVVDDERVHEWDGSPDALPLLPTLRLPKSPTIGGLVAKLEQNLIEPTLSASWWPAAGALYYVAQVSYDEGETWETLAESRDAEASWIVEPRALTLRVAAVGSSKGPWASVEVPAPTITYDMVEVTVSNFEASLRAEFERIGGEAQDYFEAISDALAMTQADAAARTFTTWDEERRSRVAAVAGARAEFYEQLTIAVGPDSALAQQITTLSSEVVSHGDDLATLDGAVETLSGTVTTLSGTVTTQGETLSTLNSSVSSLSTTVSAQGTQIAGAWDVTVAQGDAITYLYGTVTSQSDAITYLYGTVTSQSAAIVDLEAGVAAAATTTELNAAIGNVWGALTIRGVARATWGSVTVAYEMKAEVSSGGADYSCGLIFGLIPDGFGGYTGAVYIDADRVYYGKASSGTFNPLFSLVGDAAYLKGNLFLDGTLYASALKINGVTTDRIAPWAVNNIGLSTASRVGSDATFTTPYNIITHTITRTANTVARISYSCRAIPSGFSNLCVVQIRRVNGSTVVLRTIQFTIPATGAYYYEGFETWDTDNISGSTTYEIRLAGADRRNTFDDMAIAVEERLR